MYCKFTEYHVTQYLSKLTSVGIILKFDYGMRVIVSWLGNKKRPESVSWKIGKDWELCWFVSCKTDTWEYRLSRIQIHIDYGICVNLEFLIELYLDWYWSKSINRSRAFTALVHILTWRLAVFLVTQFCVLINDCIERNQFQVSFQ